MKDRNPRLAALLASCVALLVAIGATSAGAAPAGPSPGSDVIEGQYIVVFEDSVVNPGVKANRREHRLGFRTKLRYRHALKGFAARLSPGQVRKLRSDPEVDFVSRDRRVEAVGEVPLEPGETAPPGVRRILAATETTAREPSDAAVAVLDTGIDLDHPDLDAEDGTNCIELSEPADDVDGHGTHVAGTVAAKNNGLGVVGVAPGTEVHAVKVLDDDGEGTASSVACGIDWVTANHDALGIGVANMSLGGSGNPMEPCESTTDAMHKAICDSTEAGVNYVVAAGNDGWDFDFEPVPDVPAAYPEVLTVTAVSDSDGQPGGLGGAPSCRRTESDDAAASFSNFAATAEGEAHTIAAPGVCIRSTIPGGGYATFSGTSMASPHMAGVVALCINEAGTDGPCAGKTPAEVIDHMRDEAEAYNTANPGYGFLGDPSNAPLPGRYYGFLTRTPPAPLSSGDPPAEDGDPPAEDGDPPVDSEPLDGDPPAEDGDPPAEDGDPPADGELLPISNQFSFGKLNRNPRRGIARLIVRVPGPGTIVLRRNKRVRRVARGAEASGGVALRVRPRGKAQRRVSERRCRTSGKTRLRTRVRARITYRPLGGAPRTQQRRVRLVRRC